ncbi:nucleotidyltransferase family protein [Bradyrhizobium brasilense]|uniref:nucleotidyltransferase family protein n=1 Tax=Bradyrhizobium brasilense TaxID=1419277 RepID=UPI001E2CFE45|nr:nucleotidyltransferase family protein [Bradyrhizobium brasilense]MCC8972385.1 nucleotidyltransferase family protein [Bradyrhizobium brasilense]
MAKEIRTTAGSTGTVDAAAEPTAPSARAELFYAQALRELAKLDLPFLLAGTYALSAYTGVVRATKDLDIVCKPTDYPRILDHFQNLGYSVAIEDERWLGKVFQDEHFFDVIFAFWHGMAPVNDQWFESAPRVKVFGTPTRVIAPTELIWSKAFVQLRHRYDGADIAHVILKQHDQIDWLRLLAYMELHWEVLLAHLLNFRWAYPSERDCVPRWLMDELVARLKIQFELPPPRVKICRGRLFSLVDYEPAVEEWGFVDAGGGNEQRDV